MRVLGVDLPIEDWVKEEGIADAEIRERLVDAGARKAAEKVANFGPDIIRNVEKSVLLQILDQVWKEHLLTLDHLRQGIGLRAYGQRDPLNEYKREAFDLFQEMLSSLRERVISVLSHVELQIMPTQEMFQPRQNFDMVETRDDPAFALEGAEPEPAAGLPPPEPLRRRQAAATLDPDDPATWGRVPRNAPCPCQSGRKYKHCHGKVA